MSNCNYSHNYNYTYSKQYIPSSEMLTTPGSPINYQSSDQHIHQHHHHHQQQQPSTLQSHIEKSDLVNLIVLLIHDNLQSKFNLNLNNNEVNSFCTLFNLLIRKSNLSLSNLIKISIIIDRLLSNNTTPLSFNDLKKFILMSFISVNNNLSITNWSQITGISPNQLNLDVKLLLNNNITIISDVDLASENAQLRYKVSQYVKVM